jgi:hypothetical protein
LIEKLRNAYETELPKLIGDNMDMLDAPFFLRIADMCDELPDGEDKTRLATLSTTIYLERERLIILADEQLADDKQVVEALLGAAATPETGEFVVPIPEDRAQVVRAAVQGLLARPSSLGEGFVGTLAAYMQKASSDNLDGMVEIMREVLQIYASEKLIGMLEGSKESNALRDALSEVLRTKPSKWDEALKAHVLGDDGEVSPEEFLGALQDTMGDIVLNMPSGSQMQGILAEYISELKTRTEDLAAENMM